jgi:hypothetical protein
MKKCSIAIAKILSRGVFFLFLLSLNFSLTACFPDNYVPTKTSLELQAIQTREIETSKEIAFAATLSVFQDLGYIIESGDLETGLISGKSPTRSGKLAGYYTQEYRKVTGFVEKFRKNEARIRVNFVDIVFGSSSYGSERRVDLPIEDPKIYQEVFEKIEKAVFVRKSLD